jgi:hypothetical protein
MSAQLKFYAKYASIKNFNMSDRGGLIFDSDFCHGSIQESSFDNAEFNNCDVNYTTFNDVSFEDTYFYRLIAEATRFTKCNFTEACMDNFTFEECIFRECDFSRCDMHGVTFKYCHFYNCDFEEAELPPFFHPNTMEGCINIPYMPMVCPEEGEFIGYKIASSEQRPSLLPSSAMPYENEGPANVLVTLKIPFDARRSSAGGRKCRCDKAKIIGLEFFGKHEGENIAYSKFDARFEYHVGEEISVPFFDENRWNECSTGIHFFINRKEALQYYGLL